METQNNSPETLANPDIKDLMRIYTQYLGQPFSFTKNESAEPLVIKMVVKGRDDNPEDLFTAWDYYINGFYNLCIHVKSLRRTSEEYLQKVAEIICISGPQSSQLAKEWLDIMQSSEQRWNRPFYIIQKLIDFLRERGYALPYKNWSVEQLVEFGIYKLID